MTNVVYFIRQGNTCAGNAFISNRNQTHTLDDYEEDDFSDTDLFSVWEDDPLDKIGVALSDHERDAMYSNANEVCRKNKEAAIERDAMLKKAEEDELADEDNQVTDSPPPFTLSYAFENIKFAKSKKHKQRAKQPRT